MTAATVERDPWSLGTAEIERRVRVGELPEDWIWQGLGDCPPSALRWAALGYRAGLHEGRLEKLHDLACAGTAAAAIARPTLAQPDWDTIRGRRTIDFQPCPLKCRRCSTCIASLTFWERGGQPYTGGPVAWAAAS